MEKTMDREEAGKKQLPAFGFFVFPGELLMLMTSKKYKIIEIPLSIVKDEFCELT